MIKLYQLEKCPYCAKVRAKLEELEIEYEIENIERENKPQIVLDLGGFVPVIDDDGNTMNESDDIIDYLEAKYGKITEY